MTDKVQQTFERLFGPEFGHGKAFELEPLRAALDALGGPQFDLAPVIHVAGTNGKGSTIAFMRAIADAAELNVHAFTKPHLLSLRERFIVSSEIASESALIEMAEDVARLGGTALTQFDAQVAAALTLFCENAGDIILLETGMGGRNDSTNVTPSSAAVITPIGMDHVEVLGPSLPDIASHKAGILKPDTPAIVARQAPEAMAVIEARAEEVGAPLYRCGVEWDAYASHGRLVVQTETRALDLPLPALIGAHQIDNAGLACATLLLAKLPRLSFHDDAFAEGVANAALPARLQPLTRGALSAPARAVGGEVWLDGGHNAHALAALQHWAATRQAARKAPLVVIFNARARKDWSVAIKPLAQMAELFIAVPMQDGVDPALIAEHAAREGATASIAPSLQAAMQNAAQLPAPRVLICGSFLLAAETLALEGA